MCCRPGLGREDVSYDSTLVDDEAYSPWDHSEGLLSVEIFEANVLTRTGLESESRCRGSYLHHRLHPFKVFLLSTKTDQNTRRQKKTSDLLGLPEDVDLVGLS